MRKVLIIANPIAGGGRARRQAPALCTALQARGLEAELRFTTCAEDVPRFAGEADPGRFDAVVSVGGDGTLNTVLNHLPDPTLPLAMLPMGTANVLACELGLPRAPEDVAEMIAGGHTLGAAIGICRPEASEPKRFLLFTGIGLDGEMVAELERVRTGTLGKVGWLRPVLGMVFRLPQERLSIETDEGERREDLGEVLATRVRNYGGVFRMPGDQDIRDGFLHLRLFRQRSRWQWLWAAFRAWIRQLRPGRDIELLRSRGLRVTSERPVACQIDGDYGGHTPLRIELDGREARLLVPAAAAAEL